MEGGAGISHRSHLAFDRQHFFGGAVMEISIVSDDRKSYIAEYNFHKRVVKSYHIIPEK